MIADALPPCESAVVAALAAVADGYLRTRDVARAADLAPTYAYAVLRRLQDRGMVHGRRILPGQRARAWRLAP